MLRTRILIGLSLIAALALDVVIDDWLEHPYLASVLLLIAVLLAQRELLKLLGSGDARSAGLVQLAAIVAFGGREAVAFGFLDVSASSLALATGMGLVIALMCDATFKLQQGASENDGVLVRRVADAAFAHLYIALPLGLLHELALGFPGGSGSRFIVCLILLSKCGDIGGYLGGTFFGRHRIMPRVSPKKSWEGAIGGLLLTFGAAFLFDALWPGIFSGLAGLSLLLFALAVNVATLMGDFAESMLKRSVGTKDSAALLPTFGGALDIVDSLVFAVPVAYLLLPN